MHLDSKTSNRIEIFNEFSLLVILIITLVLVGDIVNDLDMRYYIGWVVVFIAANFFLTNIFVIWFKLMKKLYKLIKKLILKIKLKRLMKKRMSNMAKYLVAKHVSTPSNSKLLPLKKESTEVMITDQKPIDFRFLRHESTKSAVGGKSEIFNQIIVE